MHSPRSLQPSESRRGFTLVEIMIAVAMIGILAMLALPAMAKVRQKSHSARFISDLRTFAQAFESFAALNGRWPPNAGNGVVPTGMTSADINFSAWTTPRNSVGGRWNWDRSNYGVAAGISTTNVTFTDAEMVAIDAKIDDGDLDTGLFQKNSGRFVYALER